MSPALPRCRCWRSSGTGTAGRVEPVVARDNPQWICGQPSRENGKRWLRCDSGHVFAGTAAEREQAKGGRE